MCIIKFRLSGGEWGGENRSAAHNACQDRKTRAFFQRIYTHTHTHFPISLYRATTVYRAFRFVSFRVLVFVHRMPTTERERKREKNNRENKAKAFGSKDNVSYCDTAGNHVEVWLRQVLCRKLIKFS